MTKNGGSCSGVRVGFTGIANAAFRDLGVENAMNGSSGDSEAISAAAANAAAGVELLSDSFAGEEYRRHLASVLAMKALGEASGRHSSPSIKLLCRRGRVMAVEDKARDRVESRDSGRERNAGFDRQGRPQPRWTFSTG